MAAFHKRDTDADCDTSDRCVTTAISTGLVCAPAADGSCHCGPGYDDRVYGQFCNPVDVVGSRGDWQRLVLVSGVGCATTNPCPQRTVTPDGEVTITDAGVESTTTMDVVSLSRLDTIIRGPELLPALVSGFECGNPPPGGTAKITLELSSETLEQDVTACIFGGPDGNLAEQIFGLVPSSS